MQLTKYKLTAKTLNPIKKRIKNENFKGLKISDMKKMDIKKKKTLNLHLLKG